jgi:putative endonuclease
MAPKDRPIPTKQLGDWGEALVADWVRQQGWQIVARRWHCRWGELDIVARIPDPDPMLAFVEVKSRRPGNWDAGGRMAVTPQKQRKLWRSAELFLAQAPQYAALPCRFDVALVVRRSNTGPQGSSADPGLMERLITPQGERLVLVDYIPHAFDGS